MGFLDNFLREANTGFLGLLQGQRQGEIEQRELQRQQERDRIVNELMQAQTAANQASAISRLTPSTPDPSQADIRGSILEQLGGMEGFDLSDPGGMTSLLTNPSTIEALTNELPPGVTQGDILRELTEMQSSFDTQSRARAAAARAAEPRDEGMSSGEARQLASREAFGIAADFVAAAGDDADENEVIGDTGKSPFESAVEVMERIYGDSLGRGVIRGILRDAFRAAKRGEPTTIVLPAGARLQERAGEIPGG